MKGNTFHCVLLIFLSYSMLTKTTLANVPSAGTTNEEKVVLLTGAAGFIGSNFLKYMFDKHPHYKFIVLDKLTYAGNLDNIPQEIQSSKRYEFYQGDVQDPQIVGELMKRAHFVVHFAAETHVTRSIAYPEECVKTDIIGTFVLLEALRKSKNVERFIHISTSEVYGTARTDAISEEHILEPQSPYAGAKAGADVLVRSYWHTYKELPLVIIRPFNNYGPRQHLEKVIPRFITSAINGEPLTVHGDGSAKRDWLYVEDHCKALDRVLHVSDFNSIKHKVINIASAQSVSVLDIAKQIIKYFNLPESQIKFIGDRPGQVACHISTTDVAEKLLGWKAETSFEDGLKKTIEWYLQNEASWRKQEPMKHVTILTANNTIENH